MRKKIIGIILLVLIVFGGYKLFANVSANNVNSNSIQFSYEDIPAYNGDNPSVSIPVTGGTDTTFVCLFGLLIISAGIIIVAKNRKKEA